MIAEHPLAEATLRATLALADVPFGRDDADAIHAVGRVFLERGAPRDAVHVFQLLALVAPSAPRSWTALAVCHEALGDLARARALYGLALDAPERDTFRGYAAVNKARLDLEAGDLDAAEAALDELGDEPELEAPIGGFLAALRAQLRRAS
jgi:Flp pilus assembly protein TadD